MMLNLIYGLLALAVIIALIGIANTLALSVHERTRELGLLRAVGMTRRQLRTAIRWESVLISLLGTALGFGLGVGGAWGITQALADDGVTTFVVPGRAAGASSSAWPSLAGVAGRPRPGPAGRPAQRAGGHRHDLTIPTDTGVLARGARFMSVHRGPVRLMPRGDPGGSCKGHRHRGSTTGLGSQGCMVIPVGPGGGVEIGSGGGHLGGLAPLL